ncbi:MAG TPA: MBL fold metallo-hydrolase, partial [Gemmatimonadales bacterium]|nr:MBL fold metallo-hydrolase [Gemmatimonadales bacterium]
MTGRPAGALAVLAAAAALTPAAAQTSAPRLQRVPLRAGVELVRGGESGNVLVVRDGENILLVDAMGGGDREALRAALGPAADAVRLVVNTHYHEDHVGGNAAFGPRAVTLAHQSVPVQARKDTTIAMLDWHRVPSSEDA